MGTESSKRIIYIDMLRAFALLGILFVHVAQLYNFYNPAVDLGYYSSLDEHLRRGLLAVFEDRCRTIFCILFGSSFYLIMRNPNYTTLKFCWRCVLLMGFGLINIEFYNSDFMLCYGMVGIALVLLPIRRMKTWMLFLLAGGAVRCAVCGCARLHGTGVSRGELPDEAHWRHIASGVSGVSILEVADGEPEDVRARLVYDAVVLRVRVCAGEE